MPVGKDRVGGAAASLEDSQRGAERKRDRILGRGDAAAPDPDHLHLGGSDPGTQQVVPVRERLEWTERRGRGPAQLLVPPVRASAATRAMNSAQAIGAKNGERSW